MNIDGDVKKVLPEVNHSVHSGSKTVRNGVGSDGQDLSDEDEVRINRISNDVKNVNAAGVNQAQAALQMQMQMQQQQQQQPQGSMVCWEKFLHLRSLKVLLVEADDSTRHVVAALLRNCSYEVTEAANGVQAWKVLEDLTNHIDIVLTEVVMPFLSGIGLLCKIISHRNRNNTPVIMMSSHDSMGLVFKCLSKGAVDFLVKPIRKNELRNLWQHVWRRCHSSSGSGSESCTQTQKSIKSKSVQKSDNNPGSNEDDNGSNGLDIGDGSDNGSGTQSSWTKQAVEVDTPRLMSPWDQLTECPDSTCAQVIHSNTETLVDKCELEEQIDDVVMGKLEIPVPRNLDLQLEYRNEVPTQLLGTKQRKCPETGSNKINVQVGKGHLDLNSKSPSSRQKFEAANMTGVLTSTTDPQAEGAEFGAPNKVRNIPQIDDKAKSDSKELPSLELSVKRLRGVKDTGTRLQDDHNVLRRSDSSAFSRYNTASNANKASSRKIESDAPLNNTLEVEKSEPMHFIRSPSHCNPPNQSSNEGSNNVDMGSATNNAITKPVVLRNKSVTSSGLQPNKNDLESVAQQLVLDKADDVATMETLAHSSGPHLELQVQQPLDHHYNHHLVNNMQHRNPPSDHDDFLLKKMAEAAPQCGSSNVLGGIVEGITSNYSLKGSGSGSNQGSNGLNGGSTIMHTGGTNIESYIGLARESGSGDAAGIGNRLDQKKSAQREAALTKFRQKRKERCFRKKVRYQKRQKLAEQRPRVRGQFVRQTLDEDASRTT